MVSRYQELLNELPGGSFYAATGHVLPRQDAPYQFLFSTGAPDTKFGLFVDDVFSGEVTTAATGDPNLDPGDVIVSLRLDPGSHTIVIENDLTAQRFSAYVTIKNLATWLAAYAETLEGTQDPSRAFFGVDPAIDSVLAATRLEEADVIHIGDVHGRLLNQPNDVGSITDTYRYILRRLRQAYRIWAGKLAGLRQVISAFTGVLPLFIPRAWRPRWVLGTQRAPNYALQRFSRVTSDVLTDINSVSEQAITAFFSDALANPTGPINNPPSSQRLTVTFTGTWAGGNIVVAGTASNGDVLTETFISAPGTTVEGTRDFATVTQVTNTLVAGGLGTAAVGLAESVFVRIDGYTGADPLGVAHDIKFDSIEDALIWRSTTTSAPALPVSIPVSGSYTLHSPATPARFTSLEPEPGGAGTFDLSDGSGNAYDDRIWLNIGGRGVISIAVGGGTPASVFPTDVVSRINTALGADVRYGSSAAVLLNSTALGEKVVGLFGDNFKEAFGSSGSIVIHPGAADASKKVFGLPRYSANLSSPGGAFVSALTYTTSGARLPASTPFQARVGRGSRYTDTTGDLTTSGTEATFEAPIGFGAGFLPYFDFVTSIADNDPVKFPAVTLPFAQVVSVIYETTWASGSITVDGITEAGLASTEIFTLVPGSYRVVGTTRWLSITKVSHAGSGAGAGTAHVGLNLSPDRGGYIRIVSSPTTANEGLHKIVAVTGRRTVILRHEAGTSFTSETTGAWQLWVPGSLVEVTSNNTTTGALSLAAPGLLFATTTSNPLIELANEMPFARFGNDGDGEVLVTVDVSLKPTSSKTDTLTLEGSNVPDNWRVRNGTVATKYESWFGRTKLFVTRGASDIEVEASIPRVAPELRGHPLSITAWVQQYNSRATQDFRLDVSWDGTSFSTLATVAVAGTYYDDGGVHNALDPTPVSVTGVVVPVTASTMVLRLVHIGSASGDTIAIEQLIVTMDNQDALFLGHNTVVRNAHRSNFGEVVYVWSPDDLDPASATSASARTIASATTRAIGLPTSPASRPTTPGHIDTAMTAHGHWERFDVSEYSGTDAVNISGTITDLDWDNATLINMQEVPAAPSRLSEIIPSRVSRITGEVLTLDAFGVATLANLSNHQGPFPQVPNGTARVYRDNIPIPDSPDAGAIQPWTFTAGDEITLDGTEFSPGSVYTIDYDVLIQAETEILDLGADFDDYLWLADASILVRTDNDVTSMRTIEQQLVVNAQFRATLGSASDADQTRATLTRDNGIVQEPVPEGDWRYINATTIEIDADAFDEDFIYTLEYVAIDNLFAAEASYVLEHRSATSAAAVSSATYSSVVIDQPIASNGGDRYHQLRITISGVTDVRDIRVSSLGARGINLFGAAPSAPGIILP